MHQQTDVKIVAAGTDFGVLVNKEKMEPTHWLSLNLVKELYQLKIQDTQNQTQQTQTEISKFLVLLARNYQLHRNGELDLEE